MFFATITNTEKLGDFRDSIIPCFTENKPFEVHGIIYDKINRTQEYVAKRHKVTFARASMKWLENQILMGLVEFTPTNGQDLQHFLDRASDYMFVAAEATTRLGSSNKDLKDTLDSLKNL